jgi:hypothetical protein
VASVRLLRSASSPRGAVPAWETRFLPSRATFVRRTARHRYTCEESPFSVGMCCCGNDRSSRQEGYLRGRAHRRFGDGTKDRVWGIKV